MYKWVVGVLVISILGVGALVMDETITLKSKMEARGVKMEQMLSSIGK